MKGNIIHYGLTRPTWADDQFGHWLLSRVTAQTSDEPVIMPNQLCINGAAWVREQFKKQCNISPNEETAREMFASIMAIHVSMNIPQVEIFQQIFEAYLRTMKGAKA